jgi:hypothetical protein
MSDLKTDFARSNGLVIGDDAFVRPPGLNKPGLRMERWLEDTFTEMDLQDRVVCEDVSQLSTEQLEKLLTIIPAPHGQEVQQDVLDTFRLDTIRLIRDARHSPAYATELAQGIDHARLGQIFQRAVFGLWRNEVWSAAVIHTVVDNL